MSKLNNIRIGLEEKIKLSLAELFWFLSDISLGYAQELSEELGLTEQVVQNQLSSLESLGIIRGRGSAKIYSLCSDIPEGHLLWLRRFEQPARETTKQRQKQFARIPKCVEYSFRSRVVTCPQDPAVLGYAFGRVSLPTANGWLEVLAKLKGQGTILLTTKEAAKQVAWTIRAEWDGLNGVTITQGDRAALETATGLAGAEYCWKDQVCFLDDQQASCQYQSLSVRD